MKIKRRIVLVALLFVGIPCFVHSQKLIKGIVVDSASLEGLPGVHVQVINTNRATISDANGIFAVLVKATDSVSLSFIGYSKKTVPVNFDDELMFVRMHDNSIMLNEIVVRASFFDKEYVAPPRIESPALLSTKPLKAASGGVNFAYFTKEEKEKRKMVKVLEELDHARVYIDIVNDPDLKKEILSQYIVTEARYYDLLAYFNEHNSAVMHSGQPNVILNALNEYFKSSLKRK